MEKPIKQYKVIALSVGGRGNKIHYADETVKETDFIPGRADELADQGFLEEIEDSNSDKKAPKGATKDLNIPPAATKPKGNGKAGKK